MKLAPLIKYIGNKHRFAPAIVAQLPADCRTYYEPFAGSLAVLGHLRPARAVVSDIQPQLIAMWRLVRDRPQALAQSYAESWAAYMRDRAVAYDTVKARYNAAPNPHDFLFIARSCYGGVMRFRKDGYISTPLGAHKAIAPETFAARLALWHEIVRNVEFVAGDFAEIVGRAGAGDVVYCDPPYLDSQKIIYGAQAFALERLYRDLALAHRRGAFVALSIDGTKKSGRKTVAVQPPEGLFVSERFVALGGSMLKRFRRGGGDVTDEEVRDRLLLSA